MTLTTPLAEDLDGPTEASTSKPSPSAMSLRSVFSKIYRFLYSKVLGVVVILVLAVIGLIASLLIQAPASVRTDASAQQEWLTTMRPTFGGFTDVLWYLGFFTIWTSPLFIGTVALLAASITACTTHRIPQLWRRAIHPRTHVSSRFFDNAQYRARVFVDLPLDEARTHIQAILRRHHFRVVADEEAPKTGIYADRFRFGPFGTVASHIAFIIILLAFVVSAFTGFEKNVDVAIGETAEVGAGTGLSLEATQFTDSYDDQGRPTDYVSHLIVRRGEQVVAEDDVRVNEPLVVDGIRFHQQSFGIAAGVRVQNIAEDDIFVGAVPLKWSSDDGQHAIGRVELTSIGRELIVVTPASGARGAAMPAGSAIFEIYDLQSGERLDVLPVEQGVSQVSGEAIYTFEREQPYTGILVREDPGAIWMWIGSVLLVLGMGVTFGLRHRRLWLRLEEEPKSPAALTQAECGPDSCSLGTAPQQSKTVIALASVEKLDTIFEHQFRALAMEFAGIDTPKKGQTDA
ncbi:MAG: cytochrome c biogenesis protein ResB [Actinomycetaceae bacterium]|nr:cytochrome c biogenesis protein ResB [Actinomycetaceae bacterium]